MDKPIVVITPDQIALLISESVTKAISIAFAGISQSRAGKQAEIIDTNEICQRLNLSEPTIVRWRDKGKIPCLRIGTNIRYDWGKVLEAIEKKGS
ncbi:helix-turn-helix domain-containing protein [Algoriphagus ratkowskyi]|uniref:helix-turn-helix domain-containing protein n=1 Tax=Algoriphagus ratkowskyi TaxID=57028 RepID=UPI0013027F38|nr:helix-turn-helix domain-containing protein [Algoriphagus ratkowskyi]